MARANPPKHHPHDRRLWTASEARVNTYKHPPFEGDVGGTPLMDQLNERRLLDIGLDGGRL